MEETQDPEAQYAYMVFIAHALVRRLGGEVTLEPHEVYDGARRDAEWDRVGNNITIKLGALCPE